MNDENTIEQQHWSMRIRMRNTRPARSAISGRHRRLARGQLPDGTACGCDEPPGRRFRRL